MQIKEFIPITEGTSDPGIFKAIFMAGPPGAGKNVVIQKLGLTAAGLRLQDIDKTLQYLNHNTAPVNPDYGRALKTTIRKQEVLTQSMLGLIINTTGRDPSSIMQLNKKLKAAGYDTFMVFVEVEYNVALDRIQDRKTSATDPADKDRVVDRPYFDQAYDDATANIDFYKTMFSNQFALVTNNEHEIKPNDLVAEDEYSDAARAEFLATLKYANKKVSGFLRKPLTPKAKSIISAHT